MQGETAVVRRLAVLGADHRVKVCTSAVASMYSNRRNP
jgi:hypothetical protein